MSGHAISADDTREHGHQSSLGATTGVAESLPPLMLACCPARTNSAKLARRLTVADLHAARSAAENVSNFQVLQHLARHR